MLVAGLYGTAAGDLASRTVGLGTAALGLGALLLALIIVRRVVLPTPLRGYWVVLLAERTAATPAGDWLASQHGAGLGLPRAILCTGGLLAAGLALRAIVGRGRADE